ncbi:glycoside_hydrolase family 16 protein [Hexamita inflata]|uniref:Glycoside hydrolase family 16 protein n=1 Tax=Hexamita inflata TaxID=28002 RepID=A0AA86N8V6_9EUKA|nr:glycoside hydrolase family 16 protein [Hexamita inflata]CAI9924558.1 glycoside hydrolase family 16 protein [Hexamita inflata]
MIFIINSFQKQQDFGNLIFDENFSTNVIDESKWTKVVNENSHIEELQYYSDSDQNAYIQENQMYIVARKEQHDKYIYTSARLNTQDKYMFKYGKFEIIAKLPVGLGTWPAIWLYSRDDTYQEIDIMESVGVTPNTVFFSVHSSGNFDDKKDHHGTSKKIKNLDQQFHKYSVEWTPQHIYGFVDDKKYFSLRKVDIKSKYWHFDKEMYIILNLAVGGNWAGSGGICSDCFPQQFIIQSVKVFEYIGSFTPDTLSFTNICILSIVLGIILIIIIVAIFYGICHNNHQKYTALPNQKTEV